MRTKHTGNSKVTVCSWPTGLCVRSKTAPLLAQGDVWLVSTVVSSQQFSLSGFVVGPTRAHLSALPMRAPPPRVRRGNGPSACGQQPAKPLLPPARHVGWSPERHTARTHCPAGPTHRHVGPRLACQRRLGPTPATRPVRVAWPSRRAHARNATKGLPFAFA